MCDKILIDWLIDWLLDLVNQAEEFNDAVQVVRDWLPQAETELKFRAISEDEEGILQLIEKHEVDSAIMCNNYVLLTFVFNTREQWIILFCYIE